MAFTYATLLTALLAYTEDDSDEYAAALPTIVVNAQDKLIRDLDLEIFKTVFTGTFTIASNFVDKPATLLTASSFWYIDSSGNYQVIKPRSYDWCIMYARNPATSGTPKFFAEGYSDTQFFVVAAPGTAWNYRIRGLKRPDYISVSKATNWLSTFAGDLLFYACLVESEGFLMSAQTGKIQEWRNEYQERIIPARNELGSLARMEYSPQPSSAEPRE